MARLSIPAELKRQLADLQGSNGAIKGGVMRVPPQLSIDAWQLEAERHQLDLMSWSAGTHGDAQIQQSVPEPMTAQQEREFQHTNEALRRQRAPMTDEQRAAQAYARATRVRR